jgi:MerR family transcriptional regulator, copper efflux regulator
VAKNLLDSVLAYRVYAEVMGSLTRGQLAQRAGVNLETVRFYEKEGLLAPASRTASGYRQFAEATVERLEFVKRAKALGFSLGDIRELLVLQAKNNHCCAEVKQRLQSKLAIVLEKRAELEKLEEDLRSALRKCNRQLKEFGSRHAEGCPVLKQMAGF